MAFVVQANPFRKETKALKKEYLFTFMDEYFLGNQSYRLYVFSRARNLGRGFL